MALKEAADAEARTPPPIRLRMTSADILCARSMEVEWEDSAGDWQHWSSWNDELEKSWYEAEKLLPCSVKHIKVRFKVQGVGGPWDVCRVNRRRGCEWVRDAQGKHELEVICFRIDTQDLAEQVDAIFELAGPFHSCYLARACNLFSTPITRKSWEKWGKNRPQPDLRCSAAEAADDAAPPSARTLHPKHVFALKTKRMCAALKELINIRQETLLILKQLDDEFTEQWLGVNVGNSASAGVGIASAVLAFFAPPMSIGFAICSSVVGAVTMAGDAAADWKHSAYLKAQISRDKQNCFVVGQLIHEWLQARQMFVDSGNVEQSNPAVNASFVPEDCQKFVSTSLCAATLGRAQEKSPTEGDSLPLGALESGLGAAQMAAGSHVAQQLSHAMFPIARVLGVAGCAVSAGNAVKGWLSTKAVQEEIRQRIRRLTLQLLQLEHLLATVGRLECPICAKDVMVTDSVKHCCRGVHCFHSKCLSRLEAEGIRSCCPVCQVPVDSNATVLADIVKEFQKDDVRSQSHALCEDDDLISL